MFKRLLLLFLVPIAVQAQPKEKNVEILRDSKGHKIGSVKRENGVEKIYDKNNHYQGQYRSGDNITRDEKGHKIGTGNQNVRNLDRK